MSTQEGAAREKMEQVLMDSLVEEMGVPINWKEGNFPASILGRGENPSEAEHNFRINTQVSILASENILALEILQWRTQLS